MLCMPLHSASARINIEVVSPLQPQQPKVAVPVPSLVLAVLGAVGAGIVTYAATRNVAASVAVSSIVGATVYGVLRQKNL
jgi:hypothetical protein